MGVGAALGTFVLTYGRDAVSKLALIRVFAAIFLVELIAWGVWRVLIYPHYVSPLRHLPQPSNSHWLLGQGPKIIREPTGVPAREWYVVKCCSSELYRVANDMFYE
jgi:hypothetical protein